MYVTYLIGIDTSNVVAGVRFRLIARPSFHSRAKTAAAGSLHRDSEALWPRASAHPRQRTDCRTREPLALPTVRSRTRYRISAAAETGGLSRSP